MAEGSAKSTKVPSRGDYLSSPVVGGDEPRLITGHQKSGEPVTPGKNPS